MMLKPQDVFILLKLVALDERGWTYATLATELLMSVSEVHAGIQRAATARLINLHAETPLHKQPLRQALLEFLVHGVKYAYPPQLGSLTRGIPTASAAPPLIDLLLPTRDPPPVWSDPEGTVRGYEFSPLYQSVPQAAKRDVKLYELLALTDAIRAGRARERELAIKELKVRILK